MTDNYSLWLTEADATALAKFARDVVARKNYAREELPTLKRLAEIGVLHNRGFGGYQLTAFGLFVIGWETSRPLKPVAEHIAHYSNSTTGDNHVA